MLVNHSLIWDVIFTSEGVMSKRTTETMLEAMGSQLTAPVSEAQNWNSLHKGQKVARQGYTSGIRLIIDISTMGFDEVRAFGNSLTRFEHPLCAISIVSIGKRLSLPMDLKTRSQFPEIGRLMISVEFTNGLGYSDAASIRAAMNNQTKDTKNGLDPTSIGKGSSGKLFSDDFRALMSDSNWFRRFDTFDGVHAGTLSGAAVGGSYDFAFDLRGAISELAQKSEGIWWEKLDPEVLTLSPTLIFDPSEILQSSFDPSNFYHLTSDQEKLIDNSVNAELEQTGNKDATEEIRYVASRLTRGKRTRRQIGVDQDLAHGNESFAISNHLIRPWLGSEFINCIAFFLMTRKPKFWRNGKSSVHLIQPFSDELIEAFKETM